ncbi:fructose-bisphosphatase class II [symbiont of Argiope bruennichi]|uniref:fructose-bisphosphatase class II n=1 Tax=symbiont of Argiope bruennichi TaxID=2810479 RepID=UPI003DA245D9
MKNKKDHQLISKLIKTTNKVIFNCLPIYNCKDKKLVDNIATLTYEKELDKFKDQFEVINCEGMLDKVEIVKLLKKSQYENIFDLTIDPVEGTTNFSQGKNPSATVILCTENRKTLKIPEMYMNKIFCQKKFEDFFWKASSIENFFLVLSNNFKNLKVVVLDKPRHKNIIKFLKNLKFDVTLISDGDLLYSVLVLYHEFDIIYGIGGSHEGVIMAGIAMSLNYFFAFAFCLSNNIYKEIDSESEKKFLNTHKFTTDHWYPANLLIEDKNPLVIFSFLDNFFYFKKPRVYPKFLEIDSIICYNLSLIKYISELSYDNN